MKNAITLKLSHNKEALKALEHHACDNVEELLLLLHTVISRDYDDTLKDAAVDETVVWFLLWLKRIHNLHVAPMIEDALPGWFWDANEREARNCCAE